RSARLEQLGAQEDLQRGIVSPCRRSRATTFRYGLGEWHTMRCRPLAQKRKRCPGHMPFRGVSARRQRAHFLPRGAGGMQPLLEKRGDLFGHRTIAPLEGRSHAREVLHFGGRIRGNPRYALAAQIYTAGIAGVIEQHALRLGVTVHGHGLEGKCSRNARNLAGAAELLVPRNRVVVVDAQDCEALTRRLPHRFRRGAKDAERLAGVNVAVRSAVRSGAELGAKLAESAQALFELSLVKLRLGFGGSFERWAVHRTMTCPLSTTNVWPVMQRAASEQRKTAAAATSERLISRFSAVSET